MQIGPSFHSELRGLVIVPAYNERQSVAKLARRLHRALPEFDILVIDDGSTDDTLRQIPSEAAVVSLPFNLGIGAAMQTGYRYAALHGYDIAVQVDGDGQHRPGEVRRLVDRLLESNSDLVVGSRFLGDGKYHQSVSRLMGIHILSTLINVLTGFSITDCTSGFRVANRRVIRAFAHWYPDDYPEPEVILLLHRAGFKITELGVRMRQRRAGMSSIPLMRGLFYVLKVSTALLLDMARDPWPRGKVTEHEPGINSTTDSRALRGNLVDPGGPPAQAVQAEGAIHAAVHVAGPSISAPGGLATSAGASRPTYSH